MNAVHREYGSTPHCQPAPHDKTWLEVQGIGLASTAEQYCKAIADYIAGYITEQRMFAIMGSHKII